MKKIISSILLAVLLISTTALAADFKDMPSDWSTEALEKAVANGLLTGDNGYIKASDNMTRAEMATIMARACGAVKEADISAFTDVLTDDWFHSSMAKAVAMGAFNGSDGLLNPNAPITRQEAFVVLSRIFALDKNYAVNIAVLDGFNDGGQVSDWAKIGVSAIIERGYVSGNNGYIYPLNNISRAEFAVVMDRLIKYYIDSPDAQIPADGNAMIRCNIPEIAFENNDYMLVIGDAVDIDTITITSGKRVDNVVIRGGKVLNLMGKYGEVSVLCPGITIRGELSKILPAYVCKGSKVAPFTAFE